MTFVVDRAKIRTFDPDRGLELFADGSGPDGYERYRLVRAGGTFIGFSTAPYTEAEKRWKDADPENRAKEVFHFVRPIRGSFGDIGRSGTDTLIVEALTAFEAFHGRPGKGKVTVVFEGPWAPLA